MMSKLFGQKLFLKKILYIYSKQMHLIALLLQKENFAQLMLWKTLITNHYLCFRLIWAQICSSQKGLCESQLLHSLKLERPKTWQFLRKQRTEVWESEG